jgi:putative transposase
MANKKKHGKRFSEEKIVRILQELDEGKTITELSRTHGVSDQTIRTWRRKYAGMEISDVHEMRRLVAENSKLKRIVAEQQLEIESIKELLSKKW